MIQQRSSSRLFCRRPLWAVLAWAGMFSLWCFPSSISSADFGIAHPPRCPDGWFCRGCRGMGHAQTTQVSVSWQLPEEVPVDPQGSWPCFAPSHRSCAKSPDPFVSQQAGSMFHSHRGGWRWQETCRAWTCLWSWFCCNARSCLVWPSLPLLRQSWCGLPLSRCHPCTGLLPGTWNWSFLWTSTHSH